MPTACRLSQTLGPARMLCVSRRGALAEGCVRSGRDCFVASSSSSQIGCRFVAPRGSLRFVVKGRNVCPSQAPGLLGSVQRERAVTLGATARLARRNLMQKQFRFSAPVATCSASRAAGDSALIQVSHICSQPHAWPNPSLHRTASGSR
jgi:hypothetical protein